MEEPNYKDVINRISSILQSNTDFKKAIKEFRLGELPEDTWAKSFPACYITTAKKPEVSRVPYTPSTDVSLHPGDILILEFYVIIIANTSRAWSTQSKLYDLSKMAADIFKKNNQLADANGSRLCSTSEIHVQGRLAKQKGKLVDAMTIRVIPTFFVNTS